MQRESMQGPDLSSFSGFRSPLPGRILGGLHAFWGAVLLFQLVRAGDVIGSALGKHLFALVGAAFVLLGAPLTISGRGSGWLFLFLGNACIILHFLQGLLLPEVGFEAGTALAAALSLLFLCALCSRSVHRLFLSRHLHEWSRSPRFATQVSLGLRFHGKTARVLLLDISRTGCSFFSNERIPLAERIEFTSEQGALPEAFVVRRDSQREPFAGMGDGYRYGVEFRGSAATPVLVKLSSILHHREGEPEAPSQ